MFSVCAAVTSAKFASIILLLTACPSLVPRVPWTSAGVDPPGSRGLMWSLSPRATLWRMRHVLTIRAQVWGVCVSNFLDRQPNLQVQNNTVQTSCMQRFLLGKVQSQCYMWGSIACQVTWLSACLACAPQSPLFCGD